MSIEAGSTGLAADFINRSEANATRSSDAGRAIKLESDGRMHSDFTIPTGVVFPFSGAAGSVPAGFLLCDGSAVSRTTYADLYALIGTTYGSGDGSTTFNLPNGKGRVVVGLDSGQTEFDALGETGGAKTHDHTFSGTTSTYTADVPTGGSSGANKGGTHNHTYSGTTASGTTLQPYIVMNHIIKY